MSNEHFDARNYNTKRCSNNIDNIQALELKLRKSSEIIRPSGGIKPLRVA